MTEKEIFISKLKKRTKTLAVDVINSGGRFIKRKRRFRETYT